MAHHLSQGRCHLGGLQARKRAAADDSRRRDQAGQGTAAAGRARPAKPGPAQRQRIPGGSRRHHLTAGLTHRPFTLRRAELVEARLEGRSEEHTSELQSLMRISYAVFCLKQKKHMIITTYFFTRSPKDNSIIIKHTHTKQITSRTTKH